MVAINETAYPRLKSNLTPQELQENFSLSAEEFLLLKEYTNPKSPHTQLGFLLSLKCYQCLGYHIAIQSIPKSIVDYLAQQIYVEVPKEKLLAYMKLKQRKRHKSVIRQFMNINICRHQRKLTMKTAGLKSAATKENLADIINDILEELIKNHFEIPAFSTLERLARATRTFVSSTLYKTISNQLTDESKSFFEQLLLTTSKTEKFTSGWNYLKQEVKKPTITNIRQFLDYLEQLKAWRDYSTINLSEIPEHRLEQYVAEAMALDISDMRHIKETKRYALSAMLLDYQHAKSLDNIVTVLKRWFDKMKNDASEALNKIRESNGKKTDQLIVDLKKVLVASQEKTKTAQERLAIIEKSLPQDIDASIEACDQYLIYADDNYLPLMLKFYRSKRSVMFRLLKQIEIKSSSQDVLIEQLVDFILKNQRGHADNVKIPMDKFLNLEWLDDQWFQFVTEGKTRRHPIHEVHRQRFELGVFKFIVDEIDCADAFVVNSYENDDPNKQLMPLEDFYQGFEEYCELIGKPSAPKAFIECLQNEHRAALKQTNKHFLKNEYLSIVNGEPVLKKAETKKITKRQEEFSDLVTSAVRHGRPKAEADSPR